MFVCVSLLHYLSITHSLIEFRFSDMIMNKNNFFVDSKSKRTPNLHYLIKITWGQTKSCVLTTTTSLKQFNLHLQRFMTQKLITNIFLKKREFFLVWIYFYMCFYRQMVRDSVFTVCGIFFVYNIQSTVRLTFRKRISGHNFLTMIKPAYNDFQYHREVIYDI